MVDDTSTDRPEDTTNSSSTSSNSDGTSGQGGSTGTTGTGNASDNSSQAQPNTRNITLSIQYSYAMPGRLGNAGQQQQQASGTNTGSGDNNNNSNSNDNSNSNNSDNTGSTEGLETPTSNNTTPSTSNSTTNEPRLNPGPLPFHAPAGSFVLSFRDVPVSTPQARLESIIALATELAMRRFSELTSRPKGISVQAFQSLPVLSLNELHEKYGPDFTCSICYDPFVEENMKKELELDDIAATGEDESSEGERSIDNRRRRRRDSGSGEDSNTESERLERIKRQRTEGTAIQQDSTEGTATGDDAEEERFLHSPLLLPCGHVFGRKCMYKWTRLENTCPLCRHIIVENDQYQQQPQHNPAIDEGFERLRTLLYNADNIASNDNPNNGDVPSVNTPSNEPTEINTSAGTASTTESNSGQTNDSTPAGTTSNNFRFQTIPLGIPHIVFINPEVVRRQTAGAEANPATTTGTTGNTDNPTPSSDASATTNETRQNDATAGSRNSSSSGVTPQVTMTNAGRIHWFPFPLFFRSVNNNNGNSTNYTNRSSNVSPSNTSTPAPTTAAATTEPQPEVSASTPTTESQTTANNGPASENTSNGPYNRLRTVIGHFFDTVTANHRPNDNNNNNNNDNDNDNNNNRNNTANSNTDSNTSGTNPINFFPTGVVSVRNRNGEVTTFQLNGQGVADRMGNTFTQRQTESRSQAPNSADGHNSTTVSEDNSANNDNNNGSRDSNDNNSSNVDSRNDGGNSPSSS